MRALVSVLLLAGWIIGMRALDTAAAALARGSGEQPVVMGLLGWLPFGGLAVVLGAAVWRFERHPSRLERAGWVLLLYVVSCAAAACLGGRTTASRTWVATQESAGGPAFVDGMTAGLVGLVGALLVLPVLWTVVRKVRGSHPSWGQVGAAALVPPAVAALAVTLS